jgi:hypothetical protein
MAAILYPGVGAVPGFQVLDRAVPGWGVGGHDLVAHAFDGVEQGQLRARMRAFAGAR